MSIRLTTLLKAPHWWAVALLVIFLTACGSNSESWPGISSDAEHETIFVSYKRSVVSLNADKSRNWTYNGEDDTNFYAPPTLIDDTVYVGDFKGRIHAIDAENGDRRWMYEPERTQFLFFELGRNDRIIGQVTIGENKLFSGDEYGVFALDLTQDEPDIVWEFETNHGVWARPLYLSSSSVGELCPAINTSWESDWGIESTLFAVSLDQHLYAIDPDNGDERWSLDLGGGAAGNITLDCLYHRLYIGTMNKQVVAVDVKTGDVVDRFDTQGWVWGNPVIYELQDDDYQLYFADLAGYVYQVPITRNGFGDRSFRRRLTDSPLRATPLIVETQDEIPVLVIGSEDNRIFAVNLDPVPTGVADNRQDLRWTREIEGKALANLTWVDRQREDGQVERLIITGTDSDNQIVVALRLSDGGRVEWSYEYED